MNHLRFAIFLLLVACGALLGGCSQGNSGDEAASGTAAVPLGLDRFLLFPNPIVESSGSFQTDTNAFAQAYYSAIDPYGERNTLAAWMNKNQFGTGGQEFVAVFRDVRDLGYGRRMTGRRNSDGSIAFFVENYNVAKVPGGYSQVNVDAAVVRDAQWHVGTNAIEWSPAQCTAADPPDCNSAVNFAKYFNFDPSTGQRQSMLNLDGRGQKAMPGICINCHEGRADPLTPQSTYALVENSLSRKRGDVQGRLQGFNVDSFEWSTTSGFTRADQESVLKIFNQWVLCSYPGGGSVNGTWGTCNRPAAGANEWQGAAAALIENWYGGAALPNAQFSDTYLPAGWNTGAANVQLYQQAVVPFCRTCHLLRGTANQNDIDFDSEAKFRSYATRIKAHVFDRGNMPLAFLVYQDFWKSNAPSILAGYIDSVLGAGTATNGVGAPLQPGRPIADPGPNRMVRTGANATLYGGDSLFATSYSWTLDPATPGASIANPSSSTATFFSSFPGNYTVHLTVSNRGQSDSKAVTVTVDNNFHDPATLKFAHVKNVLQNGSTCTTCHVPRAVVQPSATPPIWYTDFDRNGDASISSTDDDWFYSELMGRVNLTEIGESPLLRKPSRNTATEPSTINHHNGGTLFDLSTSGGLANYSIIYNWILYGAQSGGVAANAGADSTNNLVFGGSPATGTVALNGNASIGATSFAWTIVSVTPAAHPNGTPSTGIAPSITNPTSATATLDVFDIGTYVVRLTASNGTDTDFADRTITVTETTVVASASPTGTQSLSFTGSAPATATLNLSSAGTTGSPLAYSWTYDSTGLLTGTCGTISNAGSATATLTVPDTAIGSSCTFRLTAANLSTTGVGTTSITIAAASGQNPTASYTATPTARCSVSGGTTATPSAACTWAGSPFNATIDLSGSASGVGTLTYQWSVTSGPSGSSITNSTSLSATLNIINDGTYTVQFFVDNGALSTGTTVTKNITVSANATFVQVQAVFNGGLGCTGCHSYANGATNPDPAANSGFAPSWANENDSNGKTLYQRVLDRVNVATPASSLLVLNPLGSSVSPNTNGHGGGQLFADENDASYITFLTWIIGGAPP